MIVAIEGIDAAGKNEQSKRLYEWFTKHDSLTFSNVRQHDFPHYETTAGGVVGRILRGETLVLSDVLLHHRDNLPGTDLDSLRAMWSRDKAIVIQSVMIADRLEWMPLLVEYAQSPHNLLLLDRYKMSGVAYGAADGLEANWIRTVQSCIPDADLNVLLDITVEESRKRRPERRDYYEKQFDKLHRARGYYLREFNSIAASDPASCLVVAGDQDPDSIVLQIVDAISRKIDSIIEDSAMTISFQK